MARAQCLQIRARARSSGMQGDGRTFTTSSNDDRVGSLPLRGTGSQGHVFERCIGRVRAKIVTVASLQAALILITVARSY
ncbi:hypothetical protein BC830DRAFT_1165823 [Chytriomyces sp. MP71]|nr:hypothetical protein BC830DRAFT_1165823 [Chytriomyces sp. MP71]